MVVFWVVFFLERRRRNVVLEYLRVFVNMVLGRRDIGGGDVFLLIFKGFKFIVVMVWR